MVLWGTTNDAEYLRALSGDNRRFLPVSVGRIDLAALISDRDQL
jgi:predicted P-loop ATPase